MRHTLVLFTVFFLIVFSAYANENVLYVEVQKAKELNMYFENSVLREAVADATILKRFINPKEVFFFSDVSVDMNKIESKAMALYVPLKDKSMVLELIEVPETFYNYEVLTSDGKIFPANKEIKHFRGVVKDNGNSLVAISFYKDEIIGLISTDDGNFNIVRDKKSGKHLFYNDKNLKKRPDMDCGTVDDVSLSYESEVLHRQRDFIKQNAMAGQTGVINKEVRFYVETEYDIYQAQGNISAVESFITGLFNQVAVLYVQENILTAVSCIFVWNSNDPYTGTSTSSLLSQFQSTRTSILGDLGILLTFRNINGGEAAGFTGLCNASTSQKLSVAMLYNSYDIIPTFSWSVCVVTHELGHLFGSRHTHACVWNGNNTAIDGCSGYTEPIGGCSLPGVPSVGGTIMSYCHQQSVGIKFNLGFGLQPGNVIRNNVTNANCLFACNSPVNFTNQTVTQGVNINSCGDVNIQNVSVTSTGRLDVGATNKITINPPFSTAIGSTLRIHVP